MKTKRLKINVRLLRRIQAKIRKEPRRFAMSKWADLTNAMSPCGTTACIGGWGAILALASRRRKKITARSFPVLAGIFHDSFCRNYWKTDRLSKLLGLTEPKAFRLFYVTGWPPEFGIQYRNADGVAARAKIAIARIDHFIKTKGRE